MRISAGAEVNIESAEAFQASADLPHFTNSEEAGLVEAAVAGSAVAFAALYERHVARVYRDCYYRTGHRADAEDLTQQTFLQAWQAIRRYRRGSAPFVAWLLSISHNRTVDHHRKSSRVTVSDDEVASWLCPDPGPEAATMDSLAADALRCAVLKLKPERRKVIILRYVEGFSVAEVAEVMGKSKPYIYTLQHRAFIDLRRLLAAQDQHPEEIKPENRFYSTIFSAAKKVAAPLRRAENS
ncbi:MAG: sigma-70 family RNA polymerase sigma factor [Chloroflexi bacterium]|nr:sigma-70 family RNA polymerase sigma factor [Chloroflexota bacterium]